jgi:DNA-binding helix-hairpin-helix protein with protein kinase domain
MPRSEVAHLLRRTGFGPRADEVETAERAGYDAAVDALIAGVMAPEAVAPLDLAPLPDRPKGASLPEQRRTYVREIRQQAAALALWWLDQMVATPQPSSSD